MNRITPCPKSPNCVSSIDNNAKHRVEPFYYSRDRHQVRASIIDILKGLNRTDILTVEPDYIKASFRSLIFRFTDIVEFYFPEEENVIHVKSASCIGYSDLGVNRRRIEKIRALFNQRN